MSPNDFPRARISPQTWKNSGQKESLASSCMCSKKASGAESQCFTAPAALQNFTRHNPHVRGSVSFFIKYTRPFHKVLLLVHLATCSFYELLEFLDHLEKPKKTGKLNHNDMLAIRNNLLGHHDLGNTHRSSEEKSQQMAQLDFIT